MLRQPTTADCHYLPVRKAHEVNWHRCILRTVLNLLVVDEAAARPLDQLGAGAGEMARGNVPTHPGMRLVSIAECYPDFNSKRVLQYSESGTSSRIRHRTTRLCSCTVRGQKVDQSFSFIFIRSCGLPKLFVSLPFILSKFIRRLRLPPYRGLILSFAILSFTIYHRRS